MDKITVIMPCWIINEELLTLTKGAVESLGNVSLVIIDNGSPLGGGYLRSVADVYIRNKENMGYARAVNEGLKLITAKYIAIVNNDIRVSPNWQEVAKEVLSEPNTFSCHLRMTDYDVPFAYGREIAYTGKERWCQGSFFVINGEKKQYYDGNYLNSYDDWDYFYQARQKGYKTAYTNKACFQHHHSYTQKLVPKRAENNKRNAEYFKSKYGDYAENLFEKMYPEQMAIGWKEGFDL